MKPSEIAEWTVRWMDDPESYDVFRWPEEYPPPYRDEHLQLARAYLRLREAGFELKEKLNLDDHSVEDTKEECVYCRFLAALEEEADE